jgi:hypothetical protein
MTAREVIVVIDELTLHGLDRHSGRAVGDALEAELVRLFSHPLAAPTRSTQIRSHAAAPIAAGATADNRSVGVQLAQRIHAAAVPAVPRRRPGGGSS